MEIFFLKRLLRIVGVLGAGSLICFSLLQFLPGSIAYSLYGANAQKLTATEIVRIEKNFQLDAPFLERYFHWVSNVMKGDFGWSFSQQQPVAVVLQEILMPTLVLLGLAFIFTNVSVLGITYLLFVLQNRYLKKCLISSLYFTASVPAFWIGFLLLMLFAVWWPLFPVYGIGEGIADALYHAILPSMALSIGMLLIGVKMLYESLHVIQQQPFIKVMKQRGLTKRILFFRHIFPHLSLSYLQFNGYMTTVFIGGSIAVESVFSWPGLGKLTVDATKAHDYLLLMMLLLIFLSVVSVIHFLIDAVSSLIDPRIQKGIEGGVE